MTKRQAFTQRKHLGAGALIGQAQRDLTAVAIAVQDAYGLTTGRPLLRLVRRITILKSALDDNLCRETPRATEKLDDGIPVTHAYYGWVKTPDEPLLNSTTSREHLVRTAEAFLDKRYS
jgi:hypothetical protein